MKNVMSSAVEAEVGALFHNSKSGETSRVTIEEMVNPQQSTPMHTYKFTS